MNVHLVESTEALLTGLLEFTGLTVSLSLIGITLLLSFDSLRFRVFEFSDSDFKLITAELREFFNRGSGTFARIILLFLIAIKQLLFNSAVIILEDHNTP